MALVRVETLHEVSHSPAELWPYLSRTDWMNQAAQLPRVEYDFKKLASGEVEAQVRARVLGLKVEWQELPFSWTENEAYEVRRIYRGGPIAEAVLGLRLEPLSTGCRIHTRSDFYPRGSLSSLLVKTLVAQQVRRSMDRIVAQLSRFLAGQVAAPLPLLERTPTQESPLRAGLEKLVEFQARPELVQRLATFLREGADVEVRGFRPWAVARQWKVERWEFLSFCLAAVRAGLLNFSWELLCPHCRSASMATSSLSEVQSKSFCEACQMDFSAQFDESVELKFSPNPSVRAISDARYCLAGPGSKPHILRQLRLEPGASTHFRLSPQSQALRLRAPQVKEAALFTPEGGATSFPPPLICRPESFANASAVSIKEGVELEIQNPNSFPVDLSLERVAWDADVLTAARVTNWQEFRDLFSEEVLSPNEEIQVGQQIIVFTDLRGSTALYQEIGDAQAYARVRDHFEILRGVISRRHGTIVKTIGDAVMATFSEIGEAWDAVLAMQKEMSARSQLSLKSSLHRGLCLAVTANDKLDFFGTAVNLAARLVDQSKGGDVTLSDDFYQHPELQKRLMGLSSAAERGEVRFRGFERPVTIWRVPLLEACPMPALKSEAS